MSVKICVYAICKNESKFVGRWLDSMSEADYIVVLDTGSDDGTYEMLKADPRVTKVERASISPWRFDVARNESMKLIPEDADVLVCTDLDEEFHKGWAGILRASWDIGKTTCVLYTYNHAFSNLGEPVDTFFYNKIHSKGYHWKYPAHEVVVPDDGLVEQAVDCTKLITLDHHPDMEKKRGYYSDLVKLGAEENPLDAHAQVLYARELLHAGRKDEALAVFNSILSLPDIDEEQRFLQKYFSLVSQAIIYAERFQEEKVRECAENMLDCDPTYYEPHLFLADSYVRQGLYSMAVDEIENMWKTCYRHYSWFEIPYSFLGWPQEIMAVAKCRLGDVDEALRLIQEPLKHSPNNSRLLKKENTMLKIKLALVSKSKNI